jgi:hypothetical protein
VVAPDQRRPQLRVRVRALYGGQEVTKAIATLADSLHGGVRELTAVGSVKGSSSYSRVSWLRDGRCRTRRPCDRKEDDERHRAGARRGAAGRGDRGRDDRSSRLRDLTVWRGRNAGGNWDRAERELRGDGSTTPGAPARGPTVHAQGVRAGDEAPRAALRAGAQGVRPGDRMGTNGHYRRGNGGLGANGGNKKPRLAGLL